MPLRLASRVLAALIFVLSTSATSETASGVRRASRGGGSVYVAPDGLVQDDSLLHEVAVRRQPHVWEHELNGGSNSTSSKSVEWARDQPSTLSSKTIDERASSSTFIARVADPSLSEKQKEAALAGIGNAGVTWQITTTRSSLLAAELLVTVGLIGSAMLCFHFWLRTTPEHRESEIEEAVRSHSAVVCKPHRSSALSSSVEYYWLQQTVAIVRHGDRLDKTPEWESFPERDTFPNDTPLSEEGHDHSRQVGDILKNTGKPLTKIISSPYLRCAQTASRIAQVLGVPVQFDLDLGEVLDDVAMSDVEPGVPQHRSPEELEAFLSPDFPDVEWNRDEDGCIKINGTLQDYPEDFNAARMRFCYKVKKLVQKAASELTSVVIVTHGDALGAVVGLMKPEWLIGEIPYTSFAIAWRDVRIMKKGSGEILDDEAVYGKDNWELSLSDGFHIIPAANAVDKKEARKDRSDLLKGSEQYETARASERLSNKDADDGFKKGLVNVGANTEDTAHLLQMARSCSQMSDVSSRVNCSPRPNKLEVASKMGRADSHASQDTRV